MGYPRRIVGYSGRTVIGQSREDAPGVGRDDCRGGVYCSDGSEHRQARHDIGFSSRDDERGGEDLPDSLATLSGLGAVLDICTADGAARNWTPLWNRIREGHRQREWVRSGMSR